MKCANCGNTDSNTLHDEGDTVYCSICQHRTRKSDGQDDLVVCPVCHHLRDRKAYVCMWCNSPQGDNRFDRTAYNMACEFERSITPQNIRYYKLKGRRTI